MAQSQFGVNTFLSSSSSSNKWEGFFFVFCFCFCFFSKSGIHPLLSISAELYSPTQSHMLKSCLIPFRGRHHICCSVFRSILPSLSLVFPSVDLRDPFLGLFLLPTLPYLVPHDCSHIHCKEFTVIIETITRTTSLALAINMIESLNYYYCKIYFIYGPRNLQGKLTK